MEKTNKTVSKNRSLIIKIASGVIVSIIVIILSFKSSFVRFQGAFPLILNDSLNKTARAHSLTRPSRRVLVVTGGAGTGKSRFIRAASSAAESAGVCPIFADFTLCKDIQSAISIMKLRFAEALTNFFPKLDSADFRALSELQKYEYSQRNSSCMPNLPSELLSKVYSPVADSLESIIEGGFNEYGVYQFIDILEYYEPIFHFSLYISGFDRLLSFGREGERIVEAAASRLSNSDQFVQAVPICVEMKNSAKAMKLGSVQVVTMPLSEKETNALVNAKVFSPAEYKEIMNVFGPHTGIMAEIFEDLKFGSSLNTSIANKIETIRQKVELAAKNATKKGIRAFCKSKDDFAISDVDTLNSLNGLFDEGLLYIKQDMKVQAANKAIADILCNLK